MQRIKPPEVHAEQSLARCSLIMTRHKIIGLLKLSERERFL